MGTYTVVVRETYEIEYEVEASSGIEARRILRDENPVFLGSVDGDPDGRPMHYDCIKRTVFSPGAGGHQ